MIPQIMQFFCADRPRVLYAPTLNVKEYHLAQQGQGATYGDALRRAWFDSRSSRGIIVLEGDIAVSAEGWGELQREINADASAVLALPYVLYRASTGLDYPVWAHRTREPDGSYRFTSAELDCPRLPDAFGLGCTFLPAALLSALPDDLRQWDWPRLDTQLSELACELGITAHTLTSLALHLHY